MAFNKPPTDYATQLQILQSRGLTVNDQEKAEHYLRHHNYYRLCAYRFALSEPADPDRFLAGTSFDDLINLYEFDRRLRLLALDAIDRIEISVRAQWSYTLAHRLGPFCYTEAKNFTNIQGHQRWLSKLSEELGRSHEIFVEHYRKKYQLSFPPIWAVCEVMSFGSLSKGFDSLSSGALQKIIADTYGLPVAILKSALHHLTYIRNHCAHHGRLWNRGLTITFQVPVKKPVDLAAAIVGPSRRLYNTLCLLRHLMKVIDPRADWHSHLPSHLGGAQASHLHAMGMPIDWQTRALWR
jgi:abortive infection bacteriophage resistance protein